MGISFDTVEDNAAFARKFSFPYALLCDTTRSIGVAYGACQDASAGFASRISYLIDEEGQVQRVYTSVNPRVHPAEVLADIVPRYR